MYSNEINGVNLKIIVMGTNCQIDACFRCNISTIMLEMDRILRPGGRVYIRDSVAVMDELQGIGKAMGWHVNVRDTSEGPHASYKIMMADKLLTRA